MPPASALSTVAVERALDVAALLVLFQAGAALAPGAVGPGILRAAGLGLAGLAAGLAAAAACGGALDRRLERFPRARELAGQLVSGAAALRRPGPAAAAGLLSLAVWGCDAFGFWAAAQALGLGEFVNAPRAVLALSWAAAGSALPAAPGALGTFEAFVRAALERFGAAPADALAYAVFAHATGFTVVTGLGLVFLWREGLSLAAARKTAQDAARG